MPRALFELSMMDQNELIMCLLYSNYALSPVSRLFSFDVGIDFLDL